MRFLAKHSRLHKLLYMLARSTAADSLEINEASGKDPDGTRATARFGEHVFDMSWTRAERAERSHPDELASNLRSIVEVRVSHAEQITYSQFTQGLPNPTSFNLIEASPLDGQMCLEFSPLVTYPIIDRLLGGNNQDLSVAVDGLPEVVQIVLI